MYSHAQARISQQLNKCNMSPRGQEQ
uniref:Uncharacterized protein n=1 Tax=Rhizophora mucronata TaxID=61149 RepID=A0A2P2QPH3_RHIMU